MIKSDSIVNLAAALLKAQREMGNATKDSKNPFFKSKYADLNSVREAVTPALHANGIAVLQLNTHVFGENGKVVPVVQTTLLHESGEYICSNTEIISKEASNPQSYGSAISYARRYGLQSMLSIGTEDDDGQAAASISQSTVKTGNVTKVTSETAGAGATTLTNGNSSSFGSFRKSSNVSTT